MRFTTPLAFPSSKWLLISETVKSEPCRHCKKNGHLKSHGALRGIHISEPKMVIRGIRIYCSNRYSNMGCGRTFSVLFSSMLPALTVRAKHLSLFFKALLTVNCVHAAWHSSRIPYSLRSAYRWIKKLKLNQATLRAAAYSTLPCESPHSPLPHLETISYLTTAFPQSDNFVRAFQQQTQISLFLEKLKHPHHNIPAQSLTLKAKTTATQYACSTSGVI